MTTRQHWIVLLPYALASAVSVVLSLGVVLAIPDAVFGADIGEVKLLGAVLLLFVGSGTLAVRCMQWRAESYLLTTQRLLLRRGIALRRTDALFLSWIQDVQAQRQRGVGFGDLVIRGAGMETVTLHLVARVDGFGHELQCQIGRTSS